MSIQLKLNLKRLQYYIFSRKVYPGASRYLFPFRPYLWRRIPAKFEPLLSSAAEDFGSNKYVALHF